MSSTNRFRLPIGLIACSRFSLRTLLIVMLILSAGLAASRAVFRGYPVYFTGRNLDHSIHGAGYFVVSVGDTGELLYTRDGRFWINEYGQICLGDRFPSYRLEPPCSVPIEPGEFIVQPDGTMQWSSERAAKWGPQCLGQIQLAHFISTKALQEVAPGYYRAEDQPWLTNPGDQGAGTISTGWREMGQTSDDIYAILFVPAILLSFVAGIIVAAARPHLAETHGLVARPDQQVAAIPPLPAPAGGA